MIAIKYRSIVQRGANKNDYYEQSEQDRKQLVDHINALVSLNISRTEDFADAVLFFASPWSRAITGQNLIVDGGLVLN